MFRNCFHILAAFCYNPAPREVPHQQVVEYHSIRRDSKAVMHWIANPRRPVRLRLAPPLLLACYAGLRLRLSSINAFILVAYLLFKALSFRVVCILSCWQASFFGDSPSELSARCVALGEVLYSQPVQFPQPE